MSLRPLALLMLVAVLLAGCEVARQGSPTTTAETSGTAATTNNAPSAPKVADPLNAQRLLTAPCDSLTGSELINLGAEFTGAKGTVTTDPLGTGCGWPTADASEAVNISFQTSSANGLTGIYRKKPYMAYWRPLVVSGYPAVEGSVVDDRPIGTCVVNVAVNDKLYFFALYETAAQGRQAQSCAQAITAASDVIKNLRGGG